MMVTARGLAKWYTRGQPVSMLTDSYASIGSSVWPVIIFLAVALIFHIALRYTRYGKFTVRNSATALRDQTYGDAWVVDASASYKPSSNWTLTVGADNLLDKYPDRTEDLQNSTFGMLPYSNYSPFGFNGAYVYGRVKYTW